jgi:hypothetical protein
MTSLTSTIVFDVFVPKKGITFAIYCFVGGLILCGTLIVWFVYGARTLIRKSH